MKYIGYAYFLISLILFSVIIESVIIDRPADSIWPLVFAASVFMLGTLCFLLPKEMFKHKKIAATYNELFDEYKDVIKEGKKLRMLRTDYELMKKLLIEEKECLIENHGVKFDDTKP